jgi:ureidoacrylate peracid hydrolase
VSSAEDADGLAAWIAPARTAVLVIDMQVDFASPDGVLGAFIDMSVVAPALAAAEKLVADARAAGVPVVFVGLSTTPETDSAAWNERMRRRGGDPDVDAALCRAGQVGFGVLRSQAGCRASWWCPRPATAASSARTWTCS